jgi:cytidine deaminase
MDEKQTELIEAARAVCKELKLSDDFSAATVGAAIRTESGSIYTGVCIDLACGLGFCAEAAAIAEMLKNRETRIISLVAVNENGSVMAPCGRCREMISQVNDANMDAQIIIDGNRSVMLRELLPEHWLNM